MRILGLSLIVALAATPLSARPAGAKRVERQADEHRRAGRYDEAFQRYREAWIAHPAPRYLYWLGQCEHLRGDDERALFFFQRYLDKRAVPPFKKKVQAHVAAARATIAAARKKRPAPRLAVLPVPSGDRREALAAEALTERLHAAVLARRPAQVRALERTYNDLHLASLVGVDCPIASDACARSLMPLLQADALVAVRDEPDGGMTLRVIHADAKVSSQETELVLGRMQDGIQRVLP